MTRSLRRIGKDHILTARIFHETLEEVRKGDLASLLVKHDSSEVYIIARMFAGLYRSQVSAWPS
jgi:hypothetical protein